ncbi:phage distal tail protein [Eubacterium aggregans]|uniref:phage distal tail protein n=1 Tax=Eubacterium aggregans TaxID=81409 RepID=UPI003F3F2D5C
MDIKFIDVTLACGGETITAGRRMDLSLIDIEGIDVIEMDYTMNDNVEHPGASLDYEHLPYREVTLTFLDPDVSLAEWHRQQLMAFARPLSAGMLTVDVGGYLRQIEYRLKRYAEKSRNLWEPFQCSLVLVCKNPLFKGVISKTLMVATWTGGWQFPWKFPFKFKDKGEPSITINNLRHCDTPVEIFFKGPAYNPKITLDTGEFIKVKKTLSSDDTLIINTDFDDLRVEVETNGVETDAFDYYVSDSTMFYLHPGQNTIHYETADELAPQSVYIEYYEHYFGA